MLLCRPAAHAPCPPAYARRTTRNDAGTRPSFEVKEGSKENLSQSVANHIERCGHETQASFEVKEASQESLNDGVLARARKHTHGAHARRTETRGAWRRTILWRNAASLRA